MLDPLTISVFVCFNTISLMSGAALGHRLAKVCPAASSQIRQCFQRHPKTEPKKHRFLDAFLAHFRLQLASILARFGVDFPLQFFDLFSIRFFLILAPCAITPTFNFGALAYTPCDFSSLRQVAKSTNTTSKYLQHNLPNQPKINKKTIKKSTKNYIRFWIGF